VGGEESAEWLDDLEERGWRVPGELTLKRRTNRNPLRKVVSAYARCTNCINNNGMQTQWWEIELECGHHIERPLRFPKQKRYRRGFAALWHPRQRSEALPAPKRCRCEYCGRRINGFVSVTDQLTTLCFLRCGGVVGKILLGEV